MLKAIQLVKGRIWVECNPGVSDLEIQAVKFLQNNSCSVAVPQFLLRQGRNLVPPSKG